MVGYGRIILESSAIVNDASCDFVSQIVMRLFLAGATFGAVGGSLFVAGATFGDVGASLFAAGAAFGDVGVSLFLAAHHITNNDTPRKRNQPPKHQHQTERPKAGAHKHLGLGIALVDRPVHILGANSFFGA